MNNTSLLSYIKPQPLYIRAINAICGNCICIHSDSFVIIRVIRGTPFEFIRGHPCYPWPAYKNFQNQKSCCGVFPIGKSWICPECSKPYF